MVMSLNTDHLIKVLLTLERSLKAMERAELDLQLQLKAAFQESHIPLFVDILSWLVIPSSFHEQIKEQNYLVLQVGGLS